MVGGIYVGDESGCARVDWVEAMMAMVMVMMVLCCRVWGAGVWIERESSGSAQVFGGDQQAGALQHGGDVAVVAAGVEHIEVGVVEMWVGRIGMVKVWQWNWNDGPWGVVGCGGVAASWRGCWVRRTCRC